MNAALREKPLILGTSGDRATARPMVLLYSLNAKGRGRQHGRA